MWSSNNDSKYSLAIGETEAFDFKEGMNALTLVPELKKNFFNESPVGFILSPMGWGFIVILYFFAGVFGVVTRLLIKKFAHHSSIGLPGAGSVPKNLGMPDRLLRFTLGLVLLLFAILTTWNPILLFLSGFAFFESAFSWCILYAAIGRTTYPIK